MSEAAEAWEQATFTDRLARLLTLVPRLFMWTEKMSLSLRLGCVVSMYVFEINISYGFENID